VGYDLADSDFKPVNSFENSLGLGFIANGDIVEGVLTKYTFDQVDVTKGQRYIFFIFPINTSTEMLAPDLEDLACATNNPFGNGLTSLTDDYSTFSTPNSGNTDLVFQIWGNGRPLVGTKNSVSVRQAVNSRQSVSSRSLV
jgi:hypothetical protein